MSNYVHGYSKTEEARLHTQAAAIASLLYLDTIYPGGTRVLEAGCGVGAQTVNLAAHNPGARFTCVDISKDSLAKAKRLARRRKLKNIEFVQADILRLPFRENSFDHVFLCFVLEHLSAPQAALGELKRVLKAAGTLTVIEGDHGSCYFSPETRNARAAWNALISVQQRSGGDPLIGRRLYPLIKAAGFSAINISPRMVYVDARKTGLMKSFTRGTIAAMTRGIRQKAIKTGVIKKSVFDDGIRDLELISETPQGTLCYTFFKAIAEK